MVTTEVWSVVDDGGEESQHVAKVYTTERTMSSEYQVALDEPFGVVEIDIIDAEGRDKEVKQP